MSACTVFLDSDCMTDFVGSGPDQLTKPVVMRKHFIVANPQFVSRYTEGMERNSRRILATEHPFGATNPELVDLAIKPAFDAAAGRPT